MKILSVIPMLETGGAQRLLADMLDAMARHVDVELTLVVYRSLPDLPFEKQIKSDPRIRFIELGVDLNSHLKAIRRLRKVMREADVCHAHLFPALYHASIASIGLKTKMIFTEHSTHNKRRNHPMMRWPERFIYSRYDRVASISDAVKRNLTTWLNIPAESTLAQRKFHTINNGINLSRFDMRPPNSAAGIVNVADKRAGISALRRQLFGRDGSPILMISRFVDSKDQPTLIRALSDIPDEKVFAAFIGSGPNLEECRRIALREGMANRVVFLGERADIETHIAASEIGVQASNWEGFGLTVVEMMAGGLPVVVSDVSGMARLVADAGLTFPRGDAGKLAENLKLLLPSFNPNAPTLRGKMIEAGRVTAARLDISITAEAYLELYRDSLITKPNI